MKTFIYFYQNQRQKLLIAIALLFAFTIATVGQVSANNTDFSRDGRLVTFHDRGNKQVILTHARTVNDALKNASITVSSQDTVEPKQNSELVATDYVVNIYRARPVIISDGAVRQKVITAAQTPSGIIKASGITALRDEDKTTLTTSTNIASDGAAIMLTIDRAVPFTLQQYGKPIAAYTHEETVGDMLKQKGIKLSADDSISVDRSTPLTTGMTVAIWRNGVQTVTVEEPITFPVQLVQDIDQPVGYHKVQTAGINGRKSVTYEITAQSGREVSRKAIQTVTLEEAKEQVEMIGAKPGNGLTKSKGAGIFTDSKGVAHRETYYDLPMNVTMRSCGGGTYTVRADGAKVDKDGYVLIAANLGNYPRCSIVETSIGLGKVYDTGGFAVKHPHGFDLATDWTNYDGR